MKTVGKVIFWIGFILFGYIIVNIFYGLMVYSPAFIFRTLKWGEAKTSDYQKLPARFITTENNPFYFDKDLQEDQIRSAFEADSMINELDEFLQETDTQAFIVIKDDCILYEKYFNGVQRDSIVTSFSVAKSFTSALIGVAINEGYILSENDPITLYLPELTTRNPRFSDIKIRDLLMMSSGIDYHEDTILLYEDDGTKTYLFPDLRNLALYKTQIEEPPGQHFLYNNYNPLLLGMIIERATGKSVANYLEEKIWVPLEMEFNASWSLDSEETRFEKMESGINARAIDFAKFGRLYLRKGDWNGIQVIPAAWVAESTLEDWHVDNNKYYQDLEAHATLDVYYKYMWWGLPRKGGDDDFVAIGKYGQFIYVSPQANLIIVRNGKHYGGGMEYYEWLKIFYQFSSIFE